MPNRRTHVVVGTVAGAGYSLIISRGQKEEARFLEFVGGCIGGWIGGRSADYFEPAEHPGHRQFAHSAFAGAVSAANAQALAIGWTEIFRNLATDAANYGGRQGASDSEKNLGAILEILCTVLAGVGPGIIAGYLSHLALDATTKKSLSLL